MMALIFQSNLHTCLFLALPILVLAGTELNIEVSIEPSENKYVPTGHSQSLNCNFSSNKLNNQGQDLNDLELEWDIPEAAKESMRHGDRSRSFSGDTLTLVQNIEIQNFNLSFTGDYQCKLINKVSGSQLGSNHIRLGGIEEFKSPAEYNCGDDEPNDISISCDISIPNSDTVITGPTWMKKDDKGLNRRVLSGPRFRTENDTHSLTISIFNPQTDLITYVYPEPGVYTAQYEITDGAGKVSFYDCDVPVSACPFVQMFDQKKIKYPVRGEEMKLDCRVISYPRAVVTWYKDGQELPKEGRIMLTDLDGTRNARLTIKDVDFSDAGQYKCEAHISDKDMTVEQDVKMLVKAEILDSVWPFIFIVGEVIVLSTIIFIYGKRRAKLAQQAYYDTHDSPADSCGNTCSQNVRNRRGN